MTPRSLFNIILKILGLFIVKDIVEALPQLLSVFLMQMKLDADAVWTVATILLVIIVDILVSYYVIFKSDVIMDWLKLDKGFSQETIPLNIHRSTILSISIIVIGGLILVNEIPNLCEQVFIYIQETRNLNRQTNPNLFYSILPLSKIIIGLLLVSKQQLIVNFIEFRRKM